MFFIKSVHFIVFMISLSKGDILTVYLLNIIFNLDALSPVGVNACTGSMKICRWLVG